MDVLKQKKELIYDIENMKNNSYEQMCLITFYSLSSFFKSLFIFGQKSEITKDNLNIIKEMFQILKKERKLLNYILKNLDKFDLDSTIDVIDTLDALNEKTIMYYYKVIGDIKIACNTKVEARGIRMEQDFKTLIQSDSYSNQVIALSINKENIKEFLGYEDEFWEFLKMRDTSNLKTTYEIAKEISYVVPIYDENGILVDIKMFIPKVCDLKTALLCIKQYQRVYSLYKYIGKTYICDDGEENLQNKFETSYLSKKAKLFLK